MRASFQCWRFWPSFKYCGMLAWGVPEKRRFFKELQENARLDKENQSQRVSTTSNPAHQHQLRRPGYKPESMSLPTVTKRWWQDGHQPACALLANVTWEWQALEKVKSDFPGEEKARLHPHFLGPWGAPVSTATTTWGEHCPQVNYPKKIFNPGITILTVPKEHRIQATNLARASGGWKNRSCSQHKKAAVSTNLKTPLWWLLAPVSAAPVLQTWTLIPATWWW